MVVSRASVVLLFRELKAKHPGNSRDELIAQTAANVGQEPETVRAIIDEHAREGS